MHDIFISYSRVDAEAADRIAAALRQAGFGVWIDATGIEEGRAYDLQIEAALHEARCAIVLWSRTSINSEWVRNEAAEAHQNGKLIPLLTDDALPPLQFKSVQAIDFRGWDGSPDARAFQQLKGAVERRLLPPAGAPASAAPPAPPATPSILQLFERLGLGFADRDAERRFGRFFNERYLAQTRMYLLIVAVLYSIYAISDFITGRSTQATAIFQFVATPVLIVAFLITLWPPILRYWRPAVFLYGLVGPTVIILGLRKIATGGPDLPQSSVIAAALLAVLAFVGTAPLRFPETVLLCAVPVLFEWQMQLFFGVSASDPQAEFEIVAGVYAMLVVSAWWRERQARRWFTETARLGTGLPRDR